MLDKYFDYRNREAAIYEAWEKAGLFRPESAPADAPVFDLTMPPPNANGELHLGHTLGYVVMDILGRYHRLKGERVLLLPGKDHAGIQTQVVYERKLAAEGVDTTSLSREELYRMCYDFCMDRSQYMRAQERRIGISADYSRELFTLDPRLTSVVYDTFERMWKDGLVYRGKRIVNWSVYSQTAISDVEVKYKEETGSLWTIIYPWAESSAPTASTEVKLIRSEQVISNGVEHDFIPDPEEEHLYGIGSIVQVRETQQKYILWKKTAEARPEKQDLYNDRLFSSGWSLFSYFDLLRGMQTATTRPETMLGDTALAVHPDDPRYAHVVGKHVKHPFQDRTIPVIADARVDMAFGTGVIKITPAHDFLDYDIGKDRGLEILSVIDQHRNMTVEAGPEYEGMTSEAAREKLVAALDAQGLLVATAELKHKVPISERGGDVIEPLVSEQWFVAVDKEGNSLRQKALALVESGTIDIHPERYREQFVQWLTNLRDWNISRQLWWGHRMPVWYRGEEIHVGAESPEGDDWTQETDTFDTWFSSGQWPYTTLAASDLLDLEHPERSAFFPTSSMVMGRDILFFWACRMLLFAAYRMETVPWKSIYFTGLIRDEHGQKMSKSKANGIEPAEMMDKYGTDALRIGLIIGTSPGNDFNLSEKKIEGYGKFVNKLWNAAKLIDMKLEGKTHDAGSPTMETTRWIAARTAAVQRSVTAKLEKQEIASALEELYGFVWFEYCDRYLEAMKALVEDATDEGRAELLGVTARTFRAILVLLHPFMPFLTEELYQHVGGLKRVDFLAGEAWDAGAEARDGDAFEKTLSLVDALRSFKSQVDPALQKELRLVLPSGISAEAAVLAARIPRIALAETADPSKAVTIPSPLGNASLEVPEKESVRAKFEKEAVEKRGYAARIRAKLESGFAKNAPADKVEEERQKLVETERELASLEEQLAYFG